jgi:hypothetical protein
MKCPTRTLIRNLSTFFAIMFGLLFLACVVRAAGGGARHVLEIMLTAECAAGFFAFVAVNTDPRKVD